jgi:succinyl-CoA synthetase beta subunit
LKIVSTNILHKSDSGGVQLGIVGDQAARRAYDDVAASALKVPGARVDGVLVTPMRSGGLELLVGVVRDPHWGPMLAVAIGGIFVEALGDSVLSPLPVSTARATEMLRGMRASALLDGVRGGQPVDVDVVASVIRRIGDLAMALGGELESLEVNPLWVNGSTIEALDAVVTWSLK